MFRFQTQKSCLCYSDLTLNLCCYVLEFLGATLFRSNGVLQVLKLLGRSPMSLHFLISALYRNSGEFSFDRNPLALSFLELHPKCRQGTDEIALFGNKPCPRADCLALGFTLCRWILKDDLA